LPVLGNVVIREIAFFSEILMNRIYFSVWRTKCNEQGMTLTSWRSALLAAALSFGAAASVFITSPPVFAQETTGGLQGTIKDASGAVVPGATVIVTTPSLPGGKSATTDSKGYYHFSNLPPGAYLITVEAKGFSEPRTGCGCRKRRG
jgi:uncharacterized protein YfaS (alpha-2-macroglobulin family)